MFTVNIRKPKISKQMHQKFVDWNANAEFNGKWNLALNFHYSYLISPLDFNK